MPAATLLVPWAGPLRPATSAAANTVREIDPPAVLRGARQCMLGRPGRSRLTTAARFPPCCGRRQDDRLFFLLIIAGMSMREAWG